jgi:quinol monooxygenase YgiN
MIKETITLIFCLTLLCISNVNAQEEEKQKEQTIEKMDNSTKYALHGKLVAQQGKGKELAQILLNASSLMKSAIGCHLYVVGVNQDNPDEIWITEIWESKEDHANSLNVPGVRELIGKAIPILNESPEKGQEWKILGGTGIE